MNIKRIILGTILGMSIREKWLLVNRLVEKYLDNTEFIRDLVEISSLDEIQLFMKFTKYNREIREGILYFKNNNESFVLEAFLDQFYYEYMKNELKILAKKERTIISSYLKLISEIYNLNIIYRGIKNNIDRNLLLQFLVDNHLFLDNDRLTDLLHFKNIDDFFLNLNQYLSKTKEIKSLFLKSTLDKNHLIWSIEKLYLEYFFSKFEIKTDDIDYQTIFKIIEILIKKDKEIRLYILPRLVEIGHDRYKTLKY